VGRSYLPLAHTALTTLEHWHNTLPTAALLNYYPDLLPLLDDYLKSTATLGRSHQLSGVAFMDVSTAFAVSLFLS